MLQNKPSQANPVMVKGLYEEYNRVSSLRR
jgi:hypothetical protein